MAESKLTPAQQEHLDAVLKWMRETLGMDIKGKFAHNDWSLIVGLHAMIETALNATLLAQFGAPELADVIAKLNTSSTSTGKIAFAKELKIIEHDSFVFIQKLSELRNFCVHDFRNFNFDLVKHLASLSETKRSALCNGIFKMVKSEVDVKSLAPQMGLWTGTVNVMMELHLHHLRCETRDLEAKVHKAQSELYERGQSKPTAEPNNPQ